MPRTGIALVGVVCVLGIAMAQHPVRAQTATGGQTPSHALAGPDYGEDGNYRSPAADGRPGVYFFDLGAYAYKKGDYAHAIDMYKVAASWAYKPAEYNLGLMYFKGQGIPVDRARGAAWMILASERGTPLYVRARDLMVTALTNAEFKQTDAIWNQLKPTYGDAVALKRAKAQWVRAARSGTGSHVGHGMGNLMVGTPGGATSPSATKGGASLTSVDGSELMGGGAQTGAEAYRQFGESDNPYSPVYLKHKTGTVTVESLQPLVPDTTHSDHGKHDVAPPPRSSSTQGA